MPSNYRIKLEFDGAVNLPILSRFGATALIGGEPVVSRNGVGNFAITSVGSFPRGKTFVLSSLDIALAAEIISANVQAPNNSDDFLTVRTKDIAGAFFDGDGQILYIDVTVY